MIFTSGRIKSVVYSMFIEHASFIPYIVHQKFINFVVADPMAITGTTTI